MTKTKSCCCRGVPTYHSTINIIMNLELLSAGRLKKSAAGYINIYNSGQTCLQIRKKFNIPAKLYLLGGILSDNITCGFQILFHFFSLSFCGQRMQFSLSRCLIFLWPRRFVAFFWSREERISRLLLLLRP